MKQTGITTRNGVTQNDSLTIDDLIKRYQEKVKTLYQKRELLNNDVHGIDEQINLCHGIIANLEELSNL